MSAFRFGWLVAGLSVAAVVCPVHSGTGAGELSLDRTALLGILDAALPLAVPVSAPGLPELTLRVGAPGRLEFRDGGVETTLPFGVEEFGYRSSMSVRYVPRIGRRDGVVRLEPVRALPDLPLPVHIDLAGLLPPVELPRAVDWTVDGPGGNPLQMIWMLHGVEVAEDRLIIRFGLLARPGAKS